MTDAGLLQNEMHKLLGSACDDVSDLDAPPCWTFAQRILDSDWLAAVKAEAYDEGYNQCRYGDLSVTYGSNLNPYIVPSEES